MSYIINSNLNLVFPFSILIMNQSEHSRSWCEKLVMDLAACVPSHDLKQLVVTIIDTQFQSQPCLNIYYTYDETLEASSCCQLPELVQAHLILVYKVGVWISEIVTTHDSKQKSGCCDRLRKE